MCLPSLSSLPLLCLLFPSISSLTRTPSVFVPHASLMSCCCSSVPSLLSLFLSLLFPPLLSLSLSLLSLYFPWHTPWRSSWPHTHTQTYILQSTSRSIDKTTNANRHKGGTGDKTEEECGYTCDHQQHLHSRSTCECVALAIPRYSHSHDTTAPLHFPI